MRAVRAEAERKSKKLPVVRFDFWGGGTGAFAALWERRAKNTATRALTLHPDPTPCSLALPPTPPAAYSESRQTTRKKSEHLLTSNRPPFLPLFGPTAAPALLTPHAPGATFTSAGRLGFERLTTWLHLNRPHLHSAPRLRDERETNALRLFFPHS